MKILNSVAKTAYNIYNGSPIDTKQTGLSTLHQASMQKGESPLAFILEAATATVDSKYPKQQGLVRSLLLTDRAARLTAIGATDVLAAAAFRGLEKFEQSIRGSESSNVTKWLAEQHNSSLNTLSQFLQMSKPRQPSEGWSYYDFAIPPEVLQIIKQGLVSAPQSA